jgi:hypothetical protein
MTRAVTRTVTRIRAAVTRVVTQAVTRTLTGATWLGHCGSCGLGRVRVAWWCTPRGRRAAAGPFRRCDSQRLGYLPRFKLASSPVPRAATGAVTWINDSESARPAQPQRAGVRVCLGCDSESDSGSAAAGLCHDGVINTAGGHLPGSAAADRWGSNYRRRSSKASQ